jgi:hypothetical protein
VTAQSGAHIIVITEDTDGERDYAVVCPGVTGVCEMWAPCRSCVPADVEALGDDEMFGTAHGVKHQNFSWGWSVPDGRCFVRDNDRLPEAAEELGLPPGSYPVEFECEDESYLILGVVAEGASR